jgi:hypothetical protein
MCIMASPVRSVSNTKIFVGRDSSSQLTVYEMSVRLRDNTGKGNAMILPVPIGAPEGALLIRLYDLSKVPDFFEPFVEAFTERTRGFSMSKGITNDALEVVRVGNYDVSIVPSVDDVKRLNTEVFDLSADTEHTLRESYPTGFAFLVAQLRASGDFHPLAYSHPLVDGQLFVPTRHEHGKVGPDEMPKWDHQIFYQGDVDPSTVIQNYRNWARRKTVAGYSANLCINEVRVPLAQFAPALLPFFHEGIPVSRLFAQGPLPNTDILIPAN